MTTLTKVTILTLQDTVDTVPEAWLNLIFAKSDEMKLAGKTDGNFEFVDMHTSKRYWLDQAAADEWASFLTGNSDEYSVVITDITIEDATVII